MTSRISSFVAPFLLRWGRWTRRAKLGVWPITESAAGLDR